MATTLTQVLRQAKRTLAIGVKWFIGPCCSDGPCLRALPFAWTLVGADDSINRIAYDCCGPDPRSTWLASLDMLSARV